MREYSVKEKVAKQPLQGCPFVMLFNLPARRLNQPPVLHAGRAGRLAGATIEAEIDVPDKALAQGQAAPLYLNHLVDSPAR